MNNISQKLALVYFFYVKNSLGEKTMSVLVVVNFLTYI